MTKPTANNKGILVFDGYCNLCSRLVHFIMKHDKKDLFRFAALQSEKTKELYKQFGIPMGYSDSVVLVLNNKFYTKSDAVFEISKHLGGLWPTLSIFRFIPRFIRDYFYDVIAKYRYKWFGMKKECFVPSENQKHKFNFDITIGNTIIEHG